MVELSSTPPGYSRAARGSKLDRFKDQVDELLHEDPEIESQRIRELLIESGFEGGKTIVDDYVREVRLFFVDRRTFQRTVLRPGSVCQFDLWHVTRPIPVGHGQQRQGYVVVATLGYSRASAAALVFSRAAVDVLWGVVRCVARSRRCPAVGLVDHEGCLHAGLGRPTEEYAAFCGQIRSAGGSSPGDPQAKGVVERLQRFIETSFEPGRRFVNELDFQDQLDPWI